MDFSLYLFGTPETIRTFDTRIRNPVLYPLSYEGILDISDQAE